ncbi:MAG: DKNYY domain-containing protein [Polyangiaceae bacterium]|nr:DKNYY domain-containing protein [Polyangiaceae bacterium]
MRKKRFHKIGGYAILFTFLSLPFWGGPEPSNTIEAPSERHFSPGNALPSIDWSKPDGSCTTKVPLGGGYYRDEKSIFVQGEETNYFELNGVDVNSFKLLSYDDTRDVKDKLSYVDTRYAKDKHRIYCNSRVLNSVTYTSFTVVAENYAHDEHRVFYSCEEIPLAHASSFHSLGWDFAADELHIFHRGEPLLEADVGSFRVLNAHFATDERHVFLGGEVLEHADPESFQVYNTSRKKSWVNTQKQGWAQGKRGVYFLESLVIQKAARTVRPLGRGFAVIDATVYCEDKLDAELDGETLREVSEESFYVADKSGVYYQGFSDCHTYDQLEGADPESFEVLVHHLEADVAKDKHQLYLGPSRMKAPRVHLPSFESISWSKYRDRTQVYRLEWFDGPFVLKVVEDAGPDDLRAYKTEQEYRCRKKERKP